MSGWRLVGLIAAVSAGVLLPKALPAALVGRAVGGRTERFLGLLPAALLGGLVAVNLLGGGPGLHVRPAVLVGAAVAAAIAAATRRTLLAMVGGWAALALGLAIGRGA